jgi:hypothetical protein
MGQIAWEGNSLILEMILVWWLHNICTCLKERGSARSGWEQAHTPRALARPVPARGAANVSHKQIKFKKRETPVGLAVRPGPKTPTGQVRGKRDARKELRK